MKTSEKIEQIVENLDTAPQKAENFSSNQEQIEVENSQNFHSTSTEKLQNDANSQRSEENSGNFGQNSINYTCNFKENFNFPKNENSDTSKNIIDPLSEIDTKIYSNSASQKGASQDEILVFSKLFPNVSLEKLEKDELFCLFSSHNGKNIAISELYTNYLRLIKAIESDFATKAAVLAQNKLSSPGSLASSEKTIDVFFTKEQVLRMNPEQISKNYETIRKSQQKW